MNKAKSCSSLFSYLFFVLHPLLSPCLKTIFAFKLSKLSILTNPSGIFKVFKRAARLRVHY